MEIAVSKNKVLIRLTDERWVHIVESHDDMAGLKEDVLECVESPDYIVQGYREAKIALKKVTSKKYLAVVYKETDPHDGFVITAYFSSKTITNFKIIWQHQL